MVKNKLTIRKCIHLRILFKHTLNDDGVEAILQLLFECLEKRSNLLPGNAFWIDYSHNFLTAISDSALYYSIGQSALLKRLQLLYRMRWKLCRRLRWWRLRWNHRSLGLNRCL